MMETLIPPSFTNTMHTMMAIGHRGMSEPLDCSTPILDLCVRRRNPTPPIPHIEPQDSIEKQPPIYTEVPTSTVGISSPGSQTSSETSETSISSDPYREFLQSRALQTTIPAKVKVPRPFKAYPKDPLSLTAGVAAAECVMGKDSVEAYSEFRKRMLAQVQATHNVTNKNMRRTTQSNSHTKEDVSYWEKRRKNNEAAKRSRDARRAKEDEIAIRAAFLEQENLKLRYEVAALRNEMEKLRRLLYGHPII